jgi:hypothetical protein
MFRGLKPTGYIRPSLREKKAATDVSWMQSNGIVSAQDDFSREVLHVNRAMLHDDREMLHVNRAMLYDDREVLHVNRATLYDDREALHGNRTMLYDDREALHANGAMLHNDREVLHANGATLHDDREALYANRATVSGNSQVPEAYLFAAGAGSRTHPYAARRNVMWTSSAGALTRSGNQFPAPFDTTSVRPSF